MKTILSVYDFDGCLMDTPLPEDGKGKWEDATGREFPEGKWWSQLESMDIRVFNIKPFTPILNRMKRDIADDDTYVILLTSRKEHFRKTIEKLLVRNGLIPDQILLKKEGQEKNERVQEIANQLPYLESVYLYDDRKVEINVYKKFAKYNRDLDVKIIQVDKGNMERVWA